MGKRFLPFIVILVACGCGKAKEQVQLDTPEKKDVLVEAPKADDVVPAATAGTNGWYRIVHGDQELRKCFDLQGCVEGKMRVMAGVEKKMDENGQETLFCGGSKETGIRYAAGYRCSPEAGQAVCMQETCECGDAHVSYGEYCLGTVEGERFGKDSAPYKASNAEVESREVLGAGTGESGEVSEHQINGSEQTKKIVRTCGEEVHEIVDDGTYSEFECVTHYLDGTGGYEEGYYVCLRENGCRTQDGRVYGAYGFVDGGVFSSCAYYVSGSEDTTVETMCPYGDCVIPADVDPSLKLMTIAKYGDLMPSGFSVVQENAEYEPDEEQQNYYYERGSGLYDDEIRYALIEGFVVDSKTCEGGVRYCHGQKNPPLRVPAQPDGYQCCGVDYVPGVGLGEYGLLKTWVCSDDTCICGKNKCPMNAVCAGEKCYCGDVLIDPDKDYNCESVTAELDDNYHIKGLNIKSLCRGEKCACGAVNCGLNMECRGNQCMCGELPLPSDDVWDCTGSYHYFPALRCGNENGCSVNGQRYLYNTRYRTEGGMTCADDVDIMPGEHYECSMRGMKYAWVCTGNEPCQCYGETVNPGQVCDYLKIVGRCGTPMKLTLDGCLCDEKPSLPGYECKTRKDGTTVNVCAQGSGCSCGTNVCEKGMYCSNGKCVIPVLNSDESARDYWIGKIQKDADDAVMCEDEDGCFCGAEKCSYHSFCQDGKCRPVAYSFVREEHTFAFDLSSTSYEDQAVYSMLVTPSWITCNEDVKGLEKDIDFAHSDHFDDYYCDINEEPCGDDECDDSFDEKFSPNSLVCSNSAYCMCGEVRCPKDAACECSLDEENRIRCGCKSPNAVRPYSDQTFGCGDSRVPVKQADAYECIGELGFICKNASGCGCGSAKCAMGALCLSAGICTEVTARFKM